MVIRRASRHVSPRTIAGMRRGMPVGLLGVLVVSQLLIGCDEAVLGPELPVTYPAMFDEVWTMVERYYAAFVVKDVDWAAVYEAHRSGLDGVTDDRAFFDVLCKMLEELEDGHVSLTSPYGTCLFPGIFDPAHYFNLALVRSDYVANARKTPGSDLTYGRVSDTVGYIHIRNFSADERPWSDDMDAVLEALAPIEGLIIDVRDNGGGSLRLATALAGRFADERRTFAYVEYRDGRKYSDLTDPEPIEVVPMGAQRFTGPIALLMNRYCFSACEGFALALGEFPHVVSVGDTTGGGFGTPLGRELPNGWTYRVPVWLMSTSDRVYLEGIGIAPDVPQVITPDDVERARDTILEAALTILEER